MALILDRSKSIGKYSFQDALTFLQNLVSQFDLQNEAARIGLVAYSDQASIEFDLDDHKSLSSLKNAIKSVPYVNTRFTNTPAGLEKARYILTPSNHHGARSGRVPKIAILLTGEN